MNADAGIVFSPVALAAALTLAFALGGCDRKPSDPPKPATRTATPAPAAGGDPPAAPAGGGMRAGG